MCSSLHAWKSKYKAFENIKQSLMVCFHLSQCLLLVLPILIRKTCTEPSKTNEVTQIRHNLHRKTKKIDYFCQAFSANSKTALYRP